MDAYAKKFNTAVAAELRAERGAAQLTVDTLAERAGMVKGTLLRYLNDKREIPIPVLYALAEVFGTEPGVILDRASERIKREKD